MIGLCDASYRSDEKSVAGKIIMLGNKKTERALVMFWRSGIIRNIYHLPKAAEKWSVLRAVDDGVHMAQ